MTRPHQQWLTGLLTALAVSIAAAVGNAWQTTGEQTTAPKRPAASTAPGAQAKKTVGNPVFAPPVNKPGQAWEEKTLSNIPFVGKASVYIPKEPTNHVVLFIGGDGGWYLGVVDMARRIAPKAIVIGISYVALRKAQPPTEACWQPAGNLEEIAHAAEKQLDLPAYHPPILLGYSSGATLVYGAVASAPANTFAGGMSLGFCPDLPSDRHVCDADNFKPTYDTKITSAMLPKVDSLSHPWFALVGIQDAVCSPPAQEKFLDGMNNGHYISVPGTGHGFGRPERWGQPFDESFATLLAADNGGVKAPAPTASAADLERKLDGLGLPLDYQWASQPRATMLFVSGDGGWAAIDKGVATYVSERGVSVVGLDSQSYFWKKKTPEQAGADLQRVLDVVSASNTPIFVGGYSFGAEVAPFLVQQWPPAVRQRVRGLVLIAAGETAQYEISVLNYVFRAKETPNRVADPVRQLHLPTFCVTGDKEAARDTVCDDIAKVATVATLPGSHHFNGKYDVVGQTVMNFLEQHIRQ